MEILENFEVILAIIASIAVAISAPLTAFIAWKGLNNWKDQHKARVEFERERQKAKIDYELAMRIIFASKTLKQGIDAMRSASFRLHTNLIPGKKLTLAIKCFLDCRKSTT